MTTIWQVKPESDWGHKSRFGIQLESDHAVSDDDGDTHTEIKLRFEDGTWGWYPIWDLNQVKVSAHPYTREVYQR